MRCDFAAPARPAAPAAPRTVEKRRLTWDFMIVTADTPTRFDVVSERYVMFYLPRRKRRDARPSTAVGGPGGRPSENPLDHAP